MQRASHSCESRNQVFSKTYLDSRLCGMTDKEAFQRAKMLRRNYKFEICIVILNSLDLSPNFEDNWLMIYNPQSAIRNPQF